ncbi:hypothetical protein KIN20_028606 [Parelaphostrongylus tenuis]|uniref:DUF4605 domain-containing protein n=1 Tax=Parelaphostrongylus tenuis TaxID=148309 RepID=A0AAD5R124_PARTN|nr:hypothetical protein KIN20_028606 [Parelaphostrongylus tenuis]
MVKILSTGEVVSDDDPRARQRPPTDPTPSGTNRVQHQADLGDNLASIWHSGNDRLRQMGLQSFEIAGYRVDPLHLVAAVLGFVLSGPMMLAIIVAMILVSQTRSDNATVPAQQSSLGGSGRGQHRPGQGDGVQRNGVPERSGPFSGPGKRLGS